MKAVQSIFRSLETTEKAKKNKKLLGHHTHNRAVKETQSL